MRHIHNFILEVVINDELLLFVFGDQLATAHDSQNIERAHGEYLLTIRPDKLRAALPGVVGSYAGGAPAGCATERFLSGNLPLPEISIEEEAPAVSSYGRIFNTASRPCAWYIGFGGEGPKGIEIFAKSLFERRELSKAGGSRDKRFGGMTLQEHFAFALAHEIRHWIQDVTAWTERSRRSVFAEYCWRKLFGIVPQLVPFGVSVLAALVVSAGAWKFFLSSVQPVFLAVLSGLLVFCAVFLLSAIGCDALRSWNGSDEKPGRIYAICKNIDRRYVRFVYRHYPLERDADNFAFAAIEDPRWLDVVEVKKVEEA